MGINIDEIYGIFTCEILLREGKHYFHHSHSKVQVL